MALTWGAILDRYWRTEMDERLAQGAPLVHPAVYQQVVADLATCQPGDEVWGAIDRFLAQRIGIDPRFPMIDPDPAVAFRDYQYARLCEAVESAWQQQEESR